MIPDFLFYFDMFFVVKKIPPASEQIMSKVKQACKEAKFVALTLDIWSDRRMRSFLEIAMHTITEHEHDDGANSNDNEEIIEQNQVNDHGERLRMPYFTHTFQVTVADGLKECESAKSALVKVAAIAKLRLDIYPTTFSDEKFLYKYLINISPYCSYFSHKLTSFAENLRQENISIPLVGKTR